MATIDMNINERYSDIAEISGISEEIVKRVLKACKQSLTKSLKHGSNATLPGICILMPEIKNKVELGGTTMTTYISVKAKPSNAMKDELEKFSKFNKSDVNTVNDSSIKLNFVDNSDSDSDSGVRIRQINALL